MVHLDNQSHCTIENHSAQHTHNSFKTKKPLNRAVREENPDFYINCAMDVQWDFLNG